MINELRRIQNGAMGAEKEQKAFYCKDVTLMTRRHHRCNDVVRSTASSLLINILYQGWPDKTSFERCILGGNIRNSHALTKKKRFFTVWWWFVYFRLLESLLSGNLREGYHMEKPGVDGRIILKLILEKRAGEHALERYGLR